MDDSGSDSDSLSATTVASILGIKGSLRFRPHGSSQKAHIILRRVELSDDSDDEGNAKSIVYFSLFAQKRIEVKPGKEILLALSDSKYKDQAVIFEGDLPSAKTGSDRKNGGEMTEEEPATLPPRDILPPKMRRTWTKRVSEQVSPMNSSPPPPQPELSYSSVAVQAEPIRVTASVQTVPPPPRIQKSSATQTIELHRNVSNVIVQTDPVVADPPHESSTNATDLGHDADEVGSTRSLSPMELGSPSSIPPQSPAPAPSTISSSISLMGPVDTRSQSRAGPRDKDLSVFSGLERGNDDLPYPVLGQHLSSAAIETRESTIRAINKHIARPIPTGPATLRPLTPTNTSSTPMHRVGSRDHSALSQAGPLHPGPRTTANVLANAARRDKAVSPASSVAPKSSVPTKHKPVVTNPFVSAGFMTEFVGSSRPMPTPETAYPAPAVIATPQPSVVKPSLAPIVTEDLPRTSSASPMEESPISAVKVEIFSPSLSQLVLPPLDNGSTQKVPSLSPMVQSSASSTSSTPSRLTRTKELPRSLKVLSRPTSPRAVPVCDGHTCISSSTQNTVVHVNQPVAWRMSPPRTVKTEPMPAQIPPIRRPNAFSRNAPPVVNKHPLPPKPIQSNRTLSSSRKPSTDLAKRRRASPPPDPRSIAYVSSGPSSNPLGIRPSSRPGKQRIVSQPTASATSNISTQQKNKKPIIVGSGWPYTRASGGVNSIPLGSSNTSTSSGSRTQVLTSEPKRRVSQRSSNDSTIPVASAPATLNNILSYSSPSPPSASLQASASNGPHPSDSNTGTNDIEGKNASLSSNPKPVNGRPVAANNASSRITGSSVKAIKTEPLDEQLPPDPHFLTASQNDQSYSLIFDFTDPPPLPSTTKARDSIPKGPRMLEMDRPAVMNQSGSLISSTVKRSLGGPASHKSLGATTNGTPTHPLPPKPLPISRRELDQRPRGIKRGISPMSKDPMTLRPPKRSFQWPVVESTHRLRIKGDGDVSIKGIAFSSDGSQFVVNCDDRTIRIWNNRNHTEIARLAHNSSIVSVAWMQGDAGIVSLGEDGIISKWTRTGQNHWQWAKIVDAGTEYRQDNEAVCFAYMRDRIAVSFPKLGVKVWQWIKGTWQPQRSILRQNVTSIKFVEDGEALLGGTRDGVLWYCEVPNGTLRAYSFLKAKVHALDVNLSGSLALVAQTGGRAHLVGIKQNDSKGKIEQVYAIKDEEIAPKMQHEFGAVFANQGQMVLFGSTNGCVLVWDKAKGNVVCGLDHCEDDIIQAIAIFDRNTASANSSLITGTKQGLLNWWSQPSIPDPRTDDTSNKRFKPSPHWD